MEGALEILDPKVNDFYKIINLIKQRSYLSTTTTILRIIIGLLFIMKISYFVQQKEPKILKNPLIPTNMTELWINDNDNIWGVGFGCINESIDQGRSYFNSNNIDISNCFFSRYSQYNGHGGVVFVTGIICSMNISFSMFYNCICSFNGGAIFFCSPNMSCIRMICANRCSASNYQFAYLLACQANQIDYLSISNCSHSTSGFYSFYLDSGDQRVDNTNSSMNNAEYASGVFIYSPYSFTSTHCTFSNNKVSKCACLLIYSKSGTFSMEYDNIVHNNCPNSDSGVVHSSGAGPKNLLHCIFNNNHNYLFCVWEGSLEVSHSFISHSSSLFSTSQLVSTSNNNSFSNRNTYQYQFFESYYCHHLKENKSNSVI